MKRDQMSQLERCGLACGLGGFWNVQSCAANWGDSAIARIAFLRGRAHGQQGTEKRHQAAADNSSHGFPSSSGGRQKIRIIGHAC